MAESSAIPVIMPGSAMGKISMVVIASLPKKLRWYNAAAAIVPMINATKVATLATFKESAIADITSSRAKAALNQCNVK